jgi:hypothetical protein
VFDEGSGAHSAGAPSASGGVKAFLAAALIPRGRGARISALLRSGFFATRVRVPGAGRLAIGWYYEPPVAKAASRAARAPVLVAWGARTFRGAGRGEVKIALTRAGRRLLAGARHLRLTLMSVFAPRGAAAERSSAIFQLTR